MCWHIMKGNNILISLIIIMCHSERQNMLGWPGHWDITGIWSCLFFRSNGYKYTKFLNKSHSHWTLSILIYNNLIYHWSEYFIYLLTQTEIFALPHILGNQSTNVPHLQLCVNGSLDIIFVLVVHNYFYSYTLLFQFLNLWALKQNFAKIFWYWYRL